MDAFSRYLKTLDYSASKVSPVVSVVKRMLAAQVNSAGIVHRIGRAIRQGALPTGTKNTEQRCGGYVKLRQAVSQQETFGALVRLLAKEYKAKSLTRVRYTIQRNTNTHQEHTLK